MAVATHDAGHDAHDHGAHDPHATSTGLSNNKLGMWVFLGSECLLFGGLISTYLLYKNRTLTGPSPAELYDIPFTSVTSFILLMSSLTMVLTLSAVQRDDQENAKLWMLATALLGSTFLAAQVYEFTAFVREGMGFTTSISSSAFFTLTGFHGVHVFIGVLMLMSLFVMTVRGRIHSGNAETVEIVGLYWHFVDLVWVIIFTIIYLIP